MAALDGLTGIVLGAIFGSVFVITCIISAIKAVRDRSRIKKRRAVRKRNQLENEFINGKKDSSIEDNQPGISYTSEKSKPQNLNGDRFFNGTSSHDGYTDRLDLSVYSIETGVDNLNFQHSTTNIKSADENHRLSTQQSKNVPSCQTMVPKRAKSHDAKIRRERKLEHLSADCLAIKKSMRRHSYERAVCDNSWLPKETTFHPPSKTTLNAYNNGGSGQNGANSYKAAFENKAYDKNDYKKT